MTESERIHHIFLTLHFEQLSHSLAPSSIGAANMIPICYWLQKMKTCVRAFWCQFDMGDAGWFIEVTGAILKSKICQTKRVIHILPKIFSSVAFLVRHSCILCKSMNDNSNGHQINYFILVTSTVFGRRLHAFASNNFESGVCLKLLNWF